jgi:hypothetical protein
VSELLGNSDELKQLSTRVLVEELMSRNCTEYAQIEHGEQFSYQIAYNVIDYTNHMPRTTLLIIDEEAEP